MLSPPIPLSCMQKYPSHVGKIQRVSPCLFPPSPGLDDQPLQDVSCFTMHSCSAFKAVLLAQLQFDTVSVQAAFRLSTGHIKYLLVCFWVDNHQKVHDTIQA